jgi:hypothetical protein
MKFPSIQPKKVNPDLVGLPGFETERGLDPVWSGKFGLPPLLLKLATKIASH